MTKVADRLDRDRDPAPLGRPDSPPGGGSLRRLGVAGVLAVGVGFVLARLAGPVGADVRARVDAIVAVVGAVQAAGAAVVLALLAPTAAPRRLRGRAVGALAAGTLAATVGVMAATLDRGQGHGVLTLAVVLSAAALALLGTLGLVTGSASIRLGVPLPQVGAGARRHPRRWLLAGTLAVVGAILAGFLIADRSGGDVFKDDSWYAEGYRRNHPPGTPSTYREWVEEAVIRYRDDPTILAWQLVNEADPKTSEAGRCPGRSAEVLQAFTADMARLVKDLDPNHLVSVGTIGSGQCGTAGDEYAELHAIEQVDLCEYHDYSPGAIPGDEWNGLARRLEQCAELDKPLFVGEMGVPSRDGLDARAIEFDAKLDAQFDAGVTGILLWRWAVDREGAPLDISAGDPALAVLADHAAGARDPNGFVRRDGTRLTVDGADFRFTGMNYYEAAGDLYDRAPATDDRLAQALPTMGPGVTVVRTWFFQCLATRAGQRDWSSFDATLAAARTAGVRVVATLTDQYHDC